MFKKQRFNIRLNNGGKKVMFINNTETANVSLSIDYHEYKEDKLSKSENNYDTKNISGLRLLKNYTNYSDYELIKLYISYRDDLAFNVIFERYNDKVKRLALKLLRDPYEAEDVVQDVFIIVLKNARSFRSESKFSTWLYSISLNSIRGRLRKNRRESNYITTVNDEYINDVEDYHFRDFTENNIGKEDNPENININQEIFEELHRAVELLPTIYKEPMELRINNGFSNNQVASQLKLSLPAVKSRILRARKQLKKNLDKNARNI